MLPSHTAVKIDNVAHPDHGATMFVYKVPGEEDEYGDEIPSGWYECIFKPDPLTIERELFREENLVVNGC